MTKGKLAMDIDIIKRMLKEKRNMLIFLNNNNTPIEVEASDYSKIHWDAYNFYLSDDRDDRHDGRNVVLLVARSQIAGIQFVKPKGGKTEKVDL